MPPSGARTRNSCVPAGDDRGRSSSRLRGRLASRCMRQCSRPRTTPGLRERWLSGRPTSPESGEEAQRREQATINALPQGLETSAPGADRFVEDRELTDGTDDDHETEDDTED